MNGTKIKLLMSVLKNKTGITAFPFNDIFLLTSYLEDHVKVLIKAVIVLSSWISGYFALKHLPLTITGPIKASQPVLTLLGAMLLFGETRLVPSLHPYYASNAYHTIRSSPRSR